MCDRLWLHQLERVKIRRKVLNLLLADGVSDANLDLIELVEHIEFCDCNLLDAVDAERILQTYHVQPATAARAACRRSEFAAGFAQKFSRAVVEFRWKWAIADAGRIRFHNADDGFNAVGGIPSPVQAPPLVGIGGGDEGIRAVVDVEQRSLCPFGEDIFLLLQGGIQIQRSVGDVFVDFFVEFLVLVNHGIDIEFRRIVHFAEQLVLFFNVAFQFLAQDVAVEQVDDTDAGAHVLVDIRGPDAPAGCADFFVSLLADRVEQFVIRHDQMRVVADQQSAFHFDAKLMQLVDFCHESHRVEDHAIADNTRDMVVEDAGRDEMQYILFTRDAVRGFRGDDDRVASVGAPLISGDDVDVFAEVIDNLSFSFVTPLCTDNDLNGHTSSFAGIHRERTFSEESGRVRARDRMDRSVNVVELAT